MAKKIPFSININVIHWKQRDRSGPWQRANFACDDLHFAALHGDDCMRDLACDSVYIADTIIMKMINS